MSSVTKDCKKITFLCESIPKPKVQHVIWRGLSKLIAGWQIVGDVGDKIPDFQVEGRHFILLEGILVIQVYFMVHLLRS